MVISTGANARIAIESGMIFAVFLARLIILVFYVVMRHLLGDEFDKHSPRPVTRFKIYVAYAFFRTNLIPAVSALLGWFRE